MKKRNFRRLFRLAQQGDHDAMIALIDLHIVDLHIYAQLGCDSSEQAKLLTLALLEWLQAGIGALSGDPRELKLFLFQRARALLGAYDHNFNTAFPFVMRRGPEELDEALSQGTDSGGQWAESIRKISRLSRAEQEAVVLAGGGLGLSKDEAAIIMNITVAQLEQFLRQADGKLR